MRSVFAALFLLAACASAPEAPHTQTGRVETAPGVSIYYEKYGDGPDVVMAPGRLFFAEQFRALAAPDRTLILYDMRNRGNSSRVADTAALTVLEDVKDLEALRAHFRAERVSLIGFSYLGLMVALYATDHPDRVERLVQIGPVPRDLDTQYPPGQRAGNDTLGPEAGALWRALEAARAAQPPPDQLTLCRTERAFFSYYLVGNPANVGRVSDPCVYENELPGVLARHFEHHFGDLQRRDFEAARFTRIRQPTLVLHGTLDRNAAYGSGREWARTIPDARLITVQGGAHALWADDPAIVGEIDAFLRGAWPARAERITSQELSSR